MHSALNMQNIENWFVSTVSLMYLMILLITILLLFIYRFGC